MHAWRSLRTSQIRAHHYRRAGEDTNQDDADREFEGRKHVPTNDLPIAGRIGNEQRRSGNRLTGRPSVRSAAVCGARARCHAGRPTQGSTGARFVDKGPSRQEGAHIFEQTVLAVCCDPLKVVRDMPVGLLVAGQTTTHERRGTTACPHGS
jgi:hypothetical protein